MHIFYGAYWSSLHVSFVLSFHPPRKRKFSILCVLPPNFCTLSFLRILSLTLIFPSDYKNHSFPSMTSSCDLLLPSAVQIFSLCKSMWGAEMLLGWRASTSSSVLPATADASYLCTPLPFCLNLFIFKIQVVAYFPLPNKFHQKVWCRWKMSPSRFSIFYFWDQNVQNVCQYIIKRSDSIDILINDFVNNIFKGISTTSFYWDHTF